MDLTDKHEVVCFCNYVTVGDIWRAIDQKGLKSTEDVRAETHAAGVCGSCFSQVCTVTADYLASEKQNPSS